jgi:hypothetical protein
VRKAAPVDYVRVCSTYGAGYFFIPGSDTCLRISGFVDGEALYQSRERGRPDFDTFGMRGRARLNLDARQPTEYGLLRAFIRFDVRRESGTYLSGGEGLVGNGSVTDATRLPDQAYVQFGGLTAGRTQSMFDFYTYDDVFTTQRTASDTKIALFAYTATFGGGLSATLSLEDNAERRNINPTLFTTPAGFNAPAVVGGVPFFGGANPGFINTLGQGAYEWPDVVGNVRFDQAWGTFQLSGAIHDINAVNTFAPVGTTVARRADDDIGFALQAGVMFKLPFISPGDQLWLQATYSDGATSYNGLGASSTLRNFTAIRTQVTDAFIDQFGNVQTAEVFGVSGKFLHYWLPNLRSNFFGGYADIKYGGNATREVFVTGTPLAAQIPGSGVNVGFLDQTVVEAGANLIWTPVKQLDIGVEAVYRNIGVKGNTVDPFRGGTFGTTGNFIAPTGAALRRTDSEDVVEARVRVRREF